MAAPSLWNLTKVYLRIGNTTFGGGVPTMSALQRELIEGKGWMTQEDFALAYGLAQVTPGTNVIAFCAATGARILGLPGAISAVVAETLPSAVLAVLLTRGYESWQSNALALAAFAATVAAVSGMMWASVWLLVKPHLGGIWRTVRAVVFAGGAFLAAWKFGITPVPIILIATVAGIFWTDRK